jgi:neutral amino acid transport system permease protein
MQALYHRRRARSCLGGFVYGRLSSSSGGQPQTSSAPTSTFFAYAMALILGGACPGARPGSPARRSSVRGALIQGSDVILRSLIDAGVPVFSLMTASQAAVIRFILVGAGLMILMIYRPQGILGDRKELALDAR